MGKTNFITSTYYDQYQKYKCPLNTGLWHYSPHGCCIFIDSKTHTIQHLYLRENCSLTSDGLTIAKLLKNENKNYYETEDYEDEDDDYNIDYNNDTTITGNGNSCSDKFMKVTIQPYLKNDNIICNNNNIDQTILNNMNDDARKKLLSYHDESSRQSWFVICDTRIEYNLNLKNENEKQAQHTMMKNIQGPLTFCSSLSSLIGFISRVTNKFIHEQMPILNNISPDALYQKIIQNIEYIEKLPAYRMIQPQLDFNLYYIDARDLFDIVLTPNTDYITYMRLIHLSSESNFLDTWRRILFNFIHELVNIHNFDKNSIRIKSSCNIHHFIKGNNKSVLPEFRCDADNKNHCMHLKARRKDYEFQTNNNNNNNYLSASMISPSSLSLSSSSSSFLDKKTDNNYTIALSHQGVICRYVLETMINEYGEEAVEKELNFQCYFMNSVFEQPNINIWERVVYETMNIDRRLTIRESGSLSRERISCMQSLCNEKRINDIHRFCLPKRFLTLAWFKWATEKLKLNVFNDDY